MLIKLRGIRPKEKISGLQIFDSLLAVYSSKLAGGHRALATVEELNELVLAVQRKIKVS